MESEKFSLGHRGAVGLAEAYPERETKGTAGHPDLGLKGAVSRVPMRYLFNDISERR